MIRLIHADALDALRAMDSATVHSIVTDPPAGIAFMNKAWDGDFGGRNSWIEWLAGIMRESLRILKPGGFALVWALPRTSGWTQRALEDAGFEIRDVVTHIFGSGFPKSLNVSVAIDEMHGATREVVGVERMSMASPEGQPGSGYGLRQEQITYEHTTATTDDAKRWSGYGTGLKPASEHWILVRKPLAESSVARNVLAHGVGALNIDASRIGSDSIPTRHTSCEGDSRNWIANKGTGVTTMHVGRWPANVVLSHTPFCERVGSEIVPGDPREGGDGEREGGFYDVGSAAGDGKPCGPLYGDERVEVWNCIPGCAVRALDEQSGESVSRAGLHVATKKSAGWRMNAGVALQVPHNDRGGASRFFYVAKPSTSEKNEGLDANTHPTVKPVELMRYFIRMVTPAGGTVLDPFAGSGTTLVAAALDGVDAIGIEREADYVKIAHARVAWAENERVEATRQTNLFGGVA